MPSAATAPEPASQGGSTRRRSIKIEDFDFDLDKDGKVDPFEAKVLSALKVADVDGTGTLDNREMITVIRGMVESEKTQTRLGKQVSVLAGVVILLIVCLTGVAVLGSIVGGESIKESHVTGSTMTSKSGAAVAVAQATVDYSIWDLPALTTKKLGDFNSLEFYIDMTASPAVQQWTMAVTRPTTAYKKATDKLVLITSEGYQIDIDAGAKAATIAMQGTTYPISDEGPASTLSRRLLTEQLETPEPKPMQPQQRRVLRRAAFLKTNGGFSVKSSSNAGGNT